MLEVEYISTTAMIADMFTKQLPRQKFLENRFELGLIENSRSEKWGSIGNGLSDREDSQACLISNDARHCEESNGIGYNENGEELIELRAFCVLPANWNCGDRFAAIPQIRNKEPEMRRSRIDYSGRVRPGCGFIARGWWLWDHHGKLGVMENCQQIRNGCQGIWAFPRHKTRA